MARLRVGTILMAGAILALASPLAVPPVRAGEPALVEVPVGGAVMVRLDGAARKVAVGNTGIADVTVEGPRLLTVFGKVPGGTTLAVLGEADKVVLDVPVLVVAGGAESVVVRYGAGKASQPGGQTVVFDCARGRCAPGYSLPAESPFKSK
jgi:hypothetical protein